jgi:hypothetical protein
LSEEMEKLRADWIQGTPATILFVTFRLHVLYLNTYRIK